MYPGEQHHGQQQQQQQRFCGGNTASCGAGQQVQYKEYVAGQGEGREQSCSPSLAAAVAAAMQHSDGGQQQQQQQQKHQFVGSSLRAQGVQREIPSAGPTHGNIRGVVGYVPEAGHYAQY
jgi:hypothetical protein